MVHFVFLCLKPESAVLLLSSSGLGNVIHPYHFRVSLKETWSQSLERWLIYPEIKPSLTRFPCLRTCNWSLQNTVEPLLWDTVMIMFLSATHGKVKYKTHQNFNLVLLEVIGVSGTGPWRLRVEHQSSLPVFRPTMMPFILPLKGVLNWQVIILIHP